MTPIDTIKNDNDLKDHIRKGIKSLFNLETVFVELKGGRARVYTEGDLKYEVQVRVKEHLAELVENYQLSRFTGRPD